MDENYDGGPAFPVSEEAARGKVAGIYGGMSKRDLFAVILMHSEMTIAGASSETADRAVEGADDLLRALAQPKEPLPAPTPEHLTYNAWATPDVEHRAIEVLSLHPRFADMPAVIRDFVKVAVAAIAETNDGIPF